MKRAVLLLAVLVSLSATRTAVAHWTARPHTSTLAAQASHLAAPVLSGPSASGFTPHISFATHARLPEHPDVDAISYTLERRSGGGSFAPLSSGPCAGPRPKADAACSDRLPANGTYSYRAVAHLASWTATSAPITISAADALPVVQSVTRVDPDPTNASTVHWRVHFSEPVSGVDPTDFLLTGTGVGGAPSVASVTGSGSDYVVAGTNGTGSGTVSLKLTDNDSILDEVGQPIGGPGVANGDTQGPGYAIDRSAPAITALKMLDTNANGRVDQVVATFDSPLGSSTETSGWTLAAPPSGATLASVSVSGAVATLNLTEGSRAPDTSVGSFTIALGADAGIHDPLGNQAAFPARSPLDRAGPALLPTVAGTNGDGLLGASDTLVLPFSEPIASPLPSQMDVTEDRAGDAHVFLTAAGVLQASDLGSADYLSGAGSYRCPAGATVSGRSVTVRVAPLTIALLSPCSTLAGVLSAGPRTPSGPTPTATYRPDPALTDAAGNPATGSAAVSTRLF